MDAVEQAVKLLESAAARLEATGWRQGALGPKGGPNCLAGALMHEGLLMGLRHLPRRPDEHRLGIQRAGRRGAHTHAVAALHEELGMEIVTWNDSYCTSAGEAADKLRFAAKRLRDGYEHPA